MKKNTTPTKVKEPIKLREKVLKNGNRSLYLDTYQNGSRSYEFLDLYLIPETSREAKEKNEATLRVALGIKAQRIDALIKGKAGIEVENQWSKALLLEWMETFKESKTETSQSDNYPKLIQNTIKQLANYKATARMSDVNVAFCKGFVTYLQKKARTTSGKSLSPKAIHDYYLTFSIALNQAEKDGAIPFNPFHKMPKNEKPANPKSTRTYLTIEEVKSLIKSEACREDVKRAFLFACFSGLRISDIESLRWGDLETSLGTTRLSKRVVKTRRNITLKLSSSALRWLPEEKGGADALIFPLPCRYTVSYQLDKWAEDAGLSKKVTFHTARHTFATMSLTAGVDLMTLRDNLGHMDVATTQIYAEVINQKRESAMDKVSALFD